MITCNTYSNLKRDICFSSNQFCCLGVAINIYKCFSCFKTHEYCMHVLFSRIGLDVQTSMLYTFLPFPLNCKVDISWWILFFKILELFLAFIWIRRICSSFMICSGVNPIMPLVFKLLPSIYVLSDDKNHHVPGLEFLLLAIFLFK